MRSNKFIHNLGFYFLGTFSTRILQILFIPLYTKYVNLSDFGYYNLVLSVIALVIPLLYQSIWEGVLRFAIEREGNERRVCSTATFYCIGITIIYTFLFLLFSKVFRIQYGIAILLMGISQMGISYWQFSARALKKNKIYSLSTVVSSAVTIFLNFILIVVFKWSLIALFTSNIAGNIAMIIVLESNIKLLRGLKRSEFDKDLLVSLIKYSFPLCVNALSWWLISSCNNLIIAYMISVEQNGIFSMANRFGSIMSLITSVITMAWLEEAFRTYGEQDSDDYFNRVLDQLVRIILSGVAMLIPFTYLIYHYFVFGDYNSGVVLTPIIYLSAAYSAFASHLGSRFLARKESDIIFRSTLVGGVVSAGGAGVLAYFFGIMGVAISSLLGFMVMCIIRIPMLNARMKLEINYIFLIGMTVFCIFLMFVCNMNSIIYQTFALVLASVGVLTVNKKMLMIIIAKAKLY